MEPIEQRLATASNLLANYAVPHRSPLKRAHSEPEDVTRFPFQRDRARIVHTQAFRRLQGKTQVFVAGEGDHFRTRLTHTMEVAQVGRDIARTLRLNEDLVECISLAHDLGHSPFGHLGEQALHAWAREHGFSFEHNTQSLRIITLLEFHSSQYPGLNLNQEVLEGLQKHRNLEDSEPLPRSMSLEAQVVNSADEIAYFGHDCDDGLKAGLFPLADLLTMEVPAKAMQNSKRRGTSLRGSIIHLLVSDLYQETERRLGVANIHSLDDVYASMSPLVSFSSDTLHALAQLRLFLEKRMYSHPRVVNAGRSGQEIIRKLCEHLLSHPSDKVLALQQATESTLNEAVRDYIAGMTDSYARLQAASLSVLPVS